MKSFICASIVLFAIVSGAIALKCYECSGSEMSDCAKGVKSAGIPVKCDAPEYDAPVAVSSEESTTEVDGSTTESHYDKMKRLGCFQPIKLYPACVTYTMTPYNGVEDGQKMVYRSCMLTADDFCKSHLQYNKESKCHACNSTDFCM